MKKQTLLAAALALVLFSALTVMTDSDGGVGQGQALAASYSDDTLSITGIAPSGFSGGQATFEIFDPSGSKISDAYALIDDDLGFACSISLKNLENGTYQIQVSYAVTGQKIVQEETTVSIGGLECEVNASYSKDVLTISGCAPTVYGGGIFTCSILFDGDIVSDAYARVGSDGKFSVSIFAESLVSGDYQIQSRFDIAGERSYKYSVGFTIENASSEFGEYSLKVISADSQNAQFETIRTADGTSQGSYGLAYDIVDRSLSITGFETSSESVVLLIPNTIQIDETPYAVSSLSEGFARNGHIVGVVFSDQFKGSVPNNAFMGSSKLSFVEFSPYTERIGDNAFNGTALESIVLPRDLQEIGFNAFIYCRSLKTVSSQEGASGLNKISASAFGYTSLESVKIPMKDLDNFDLKDGKFGSKNLETFESTNGYGKYVFQDEYKNWLFKKSEGGTVDTLVFIPAGTSGEIKIPEGIKTVEASFVDCEGKFTVSFPSTVEYISDYLGFFETDVTSVTFDDNCKITELGRLFYRCKSLEEISIPSSVSCLKKTFLGCTNLKTVNIRGGTISITGAFSGCTSMTDGSLKIAGSAKVTLGSSSFEGCKFQTFNVPDGVVKIGDNAFINCKNLTSVGIPASVQEISQSAFSGCGSLKEFDTKSSNTFSFTGGILTGYGEIVAVPQKAVSVTIPGTVSKVLADHFKGLSSLTDVSFEDGNNDLAVPDACFEYCLELRQVRLSSNVISIGDNAFNGCSKLSQVDIPENSRLKSIGAEAFYNTNLTGFYLPSSVEAIGDSAFENCHVLAVMEVPEGSELKTIGSRAFASTIIRAFMVPSGVESIGQSCFDGCILLSAISVQSGNGAYSLKGGALCEGTTMIFVPAGITELTIASDITGYEVTTTSSAFSSASSLSRIEVESGNPVYLAENGVLLKRTESGTVLDYVPANIGSVEIPSTIKSIQGRTSKFDAPFRDVTQLDSLIWESDSVTLAGGSLQPVKSIGTLVLDADTVVINGSAFFKNDIGNAILRASETMKLSDIAFQSSSIGTLLIESKDFDFGGFLNDAKISVLCTDNIDAPFGNTLSGTGTPVYTKEPETSVISYGTLAGTYLLDVEAWKVELSKGFVDGKPVFIENSLDGIFVEVNSELSGNGKVVVTLTNNGFPKTFWDIDVKVNSILADNGGNGRYSTTISSAAERVNVEIRAHTSSLSATVSFSTDGGTDVAPRTVPIGGTLYGNMPSNPVRNGYTFRGWYSDGAFSTEYDPATKVEADITIYAKWESNGENARITFGTEHGTVVAKVSGAELVSGNLVSIGSTVEFEYVPSNGWELLYWIVNGSPIEDDGNSITATSDVVVSPALRYVSQSNSLTNLIDVETPRYGEDVTLQWSHHYAINTGMSVWSGFPSVPAVMDDAVYIRASDTLYKYDSKTGEELCRVESKTLVAYYLYLGVGNGVVVDYATDKVFDADLNHLYTTAKHFTAVFYNQGDGYFYGLSDGRVYRFLPSTGEMDKTGSWADGVSVTWFGLYGTTSAPVFTDDHMYIVSAKTSDDYRGLTAISLKDGSTSTIELTSESGRLLDDGWLTTYSLDGKRYLFLTTYSQGLFDTGSNYRPASIIGVEVNSNGTLSQDCKAIRVDTDLGGISAFVVYKGRGYASGLVMNADKICEALSSGTKQITWSQCQSDGYLIYKEAAVASHGGIVVSTAYATHENDYTVYIYMLAYNPADQAIYIFEDSQSKTVAGSYYRTSKAGDAYGSQAIRATKDGNLVWYTDAGTVYCYGTPANNPYTFEIEYSGKTLTITSSAKTALEALKSGLKAEGIQYTISNSGLVSSIDGSSGDWKAQYYYGAKWVNAGLLSVDTLNVYHKFKLVLDDDESDESSDVEVKIDKSAINLYSSGGSNRTATITATIDCEGAVEIIWSSDHPDVVRISGSTTGATATIEGLSNGTATISVTVKSGSKVDEAACTVTVSTPPVEDKVYYFEIRMNVDADKVTNTKYTQSMLESGFTIQATAKNAADALSKACSENGIPLVQYSGGDLKGWITSMFGLGDVNLGNGEWKYWIQYYEGSYNNYTLGYYTNGGHFQLIYGITKEMDVNPDKGGGTSEKTNTDGSKETSSTTTKEDSQGNKVQETTTTKENPDGSKVETETNTVTKADGSGSTTTKTETETDSQGNVTGKTETVTETTVVKNKDGTTSETVSEKVTKQDGSVKESESTVTTQKDGTKQEQKTEKSTDKDGSVTETTSSSVTTKDGTVTTEGTSVSKDAAGNASGTTEFTETVKTSSNKTTTTRSESYTDASGNASGSKDIVTEEKKTSTGTETVKTESVKDADGNAVSSTESTTKVQTKAVSGGSNIVTTSSEVSKDADGNTTSTREEVRDVTIGKSSTKVESTVVQKDADGKETLRQELSSESKTAKDGSVTTTVSQKESSEDKTVESSSKTVKGADGSESKESTRTTSTADETVEEKSESSKAVSGGTTTETKKAQETVKDSQGNVKSETKKVDESVESADGKSKYSSEQVRKDGSVELTESSSMESADGSVSSKTDVSVKDGKVQKAESVTSVATTDGSLDADAAKAAVEQSKASIGKTSVDTDKVQKTLKVESAEGTGLTLSPEAMAVISDHGASLKVEGSVGSSRGSVTVGTDVCTSLSKDADGKIGLSMDEGKDGDLTEAQKATVKERYFIVLGATVGDKKVHDLGGKAMVEFGYSPRDGQDVSRLCVFYVADDGSRTRMDSTFDLETGMFSMATDHFSVFMVAEAEDGNGTSTALVAGIAAALIAGIVAVFLVMRSRKS